MHEGEVFLLDGNDHTFSGRMWGCEEIVECAKNGLEGCTLWDGGLEGLGIHPTTWPDSAKEGFTYDIKNTLVRTHDW